MKNPNPIKYKDYFFSQLNEAEEATDPNTKITYNDPESGEKREIKYSTALTYATDHPAYIAAKKIRGGGDSEKEKEPKGADLFAGGASSFSDDEHNDEHGGHGKSEHGAHSHGPSNLSRKQRLVIAAVDVAAKALHIPGLENVAGQMEKITSNIKDVLHDAKEAEGFLNKAKAVGSSAMEKLKAAGEKSMVHITNSMHHENTGERKSIGKMFKDKAVGLGKSVYKGIKHEVEHIGHGLKGGVDVAKKVIKGEKLTDEDKDKIVGAVRAVADVAVIGLACASGPMGMGMKAASLAMNPGDALKTLLTASIRINMKPYQSMIRESRISNREKILDLIEAEVKKSVDELTEEELIGMLLSEAGKELETVDDPFENYSEEDMDMCVDYALYSEEVSIASKSEENKKSLEKLAKIQ